MFGLFDTKNQKLVKKWEKEHSDIVELAGKVIVTYSESDPDKVRSLLKKLSLVTTSHLMSEDLELYKLVKDSARKDVKTDDLIKTFKNSFSGVKVGLMMFLKRYSEDGSAIDEEFFKAFNATIEVVGKRIAFEENNLYRYLK